MNKITYRLAHGLDTDIIIDIFNKTSENKITMLHAYIKNHMIEKNLYIIEKNDKRIGLFIVHPTRFSNPYTLEKASKPIIWIAQILILKEYQKQGIGRIIMNIIIEKYYNFEIRLSCKEHIIEFYERFNFHITYKGTNLNEDYYIMSRAKTI